MLVNERFSGSCYRAQTLASILAKSRKLLLAIEVGPRTGELAQRVVHQVAQRVASSCMPLWFSDGFKG